MTQATTVELKWDDDLATLWLKPPPGKPPTLNTEVLASLERVVDSLGKQTPRAVMVRSNTDKYFCVGADIASLQKIDEDAITAWVEHGHRVLAKLEDLPCPTVARVAGYALGGGLELALVCDLIFADRHARLGLTEARLGFIPGWGGCQRLAERIGDSAAKYMFFAGRLFEGDAALRIGLIDHLADQDQLDQELGGYLNDLGACSAYAQAAFKQLTATRRHRDRKQNEEAEMAKSRSCLRDPQTQQRLHAFFESRSRK